jgi:hypothetical protein
MKDILYPPVEKYMNKLLPKRDAVPLALFLGADFFFGRHPERSPAHFLPRRSSAGAGRSRRISAKIGARVMMKTWEKL